MPERQADRWGLSVADYLAALGVTEDRPGLRV